MKINVVKDNYTKDITIRTSGRADLLYLTREQISGSKDRKIYYTLHKGYFRNNRLKIIGVDLIDYY